MNWETPIRISAWERYMSLDHGPNHSMTCFTRFWFDGDLDRETVTQAVVETASHHKLFATKLIGNGWQPVSFDMEQQIDWNDASVPIDWSHYEPDDYRVRLSFRTGSLNDLGINESAFQNKPGVLLVVRYPHAVADGMGVNHFIKDLSDLLAGRPLKDSHSSCFNERYRFGITWLDQVRRLRWDLDRNWKYFVRWPASAFPKQISNPTPDESTIVFEELTTSTEFCDRIRRQARHQKVSVNDLLIAVYFRIISDRVASNRHIRMGIPVSMRSENQEAFCNMVSMVFLDRRSMEVVDPRFVAGISNEMQAVKDRKLGFSMIAFLNLACGLRGLLFRHFLSFRSTKTTTFLTNLGKPFSDFPDFGLLDARLARTDVIAPIRPGTNIGLSVVEHKGKLNLTLRYNASVFTQAQAKEILDEFYTGCQNTISQ